MAGSGNAHTAPSSLHKALRIEILGIGEVGTKVLRLEILQIGIHVGAWGCQAPGLLDQRCWRWMASCSKTAPMPL
eukprot:11917567-Karenia_brevis.AAC.1